MVTITFLVAVADEAYLAPSLRTLLPLGQVIDPILS